VKRRYHTLAYVKRECESLAAQLAAMAHHAKAEQP